MKKFYIVLIVLISLSLLLSACASKATPAPAADKLAEVMEKGLPDRLYRSSLPTPIRAG